MCPVCQAEYESPLRPAVSRAAERVPGCGPRLALFGKNETKDERQKDDTPLLRRSSFVVTVQDDDALAAAVEVIRAGKILAVKGLAAFT